MLIKSLVIGLLSSNTSILTKDQNQILKIIATVLDFNQQESERVNLNKSQQSSWFASILQPQNFPASNQNPSEQSLLQAFVHFLENESQPKVLPSLLNSTSINLGKSESGSGSSTSATTPSQSPVVLSEIVLPTFSDFGVGRNSSSILKDVLRDNTNK